MLAMSIEALLRAMALAIAMAIVMAIAMAVVFVVVLAGLTFKLYRSLAARGYGISFSLGFGFEV